MTRLAGAPRGRGAAERGVEERSVPVRPGAPAWWVTKARQLARHAAARVTPEERAELAGWVTPAQLAAFDAMHPADRRHGLDVVAHLRAAGAAADRELLLAGLLHDAGKGRIGALPRVVWSLGEAFGPGVTSMARRIPGLGPDLAILREHAERSAGIVRSVGGGERVARLVREQESPSDAAGALLHAADEAS